MGVLLYLASKLVFKLYDIRNSDFVPLWRGFTFRMWISNKTEAREDREEVKAAFKIL